jgi:hypothetical protein
MLKGTKDISALAQLNAGALTMEQMNETIASHYPPRMSFYDQFESKGGVAKIIKVALDSVKLWKNEALGESWELWLKELDSFSSIPLFF